MENTLLINYDDILFYTQITGEIDQYRIMPHILNAQILYLEPILGTSLYEKILNLVANDTISGSTNYNTLLLQYITPSVVFHTMELFIPLNAFQIADGGTFQFTPSNAQYSPLTDIDKIATKYKIVGSKYDDKLYAYLCKNKDLYPEYTADDNLVKRTENAPRCNWYLGTDHSKSKIRI